MLPPGSTLPPASTLSTSVPSSLCKTGAAPAPPTPRGQRLQGEQQDGGRAHLFTPIILGLFLGCLPHAMPQDQSAACPPGCVKTPGVLRMLGVGVNKINLFASPSGELPRPGVPCSSGCPDAASHIVIHCASHGVSCWVPGAPAWAQYRLQGTFLEAPGGKPAVAKAGLRAPAAGAPAPLRGPATCPRPRNACTRLKRSRQPYERLGFRGWAAQTPESPSARCRGQPSITWGLGWKDPRCAAVRAPLGESPAEKGVPAGVGGAWWARGIQQREEEGKQGSEGPQADRPRPWRGQNASVGGEEEGGG